MFFGKYGIVNTGTEIPVPEIETVDKMEKKFGSPAVQPVKSFLALLLVFAAVLRLAVAYMTVHNFDISFYYDWATGASADLFGAYDNISNLDYPPLFLFPLWITGKLLKLGAVEQFLPFQMLVLKGWQIAGDLAVTLLLYLALRRWHPYAGAGAAALWAVNPAAIVNSSYWGQTDSIMIAFLVAAFWLLTDQRPEAASVVMALGCLMKFQTLYFLPLFGLGVLTQFPWRRVLLSVLGAAATGLLVFLPFMARSGWDLPLRVYFGGFAAYPGAVLNGFNLYGALGLNFIHVDEMLVGGLTIDAFSCLMLLFAFVSLVYFYFTATEKSFWLLGFLLIQTIFLFTARMHERYQIPALAFALAACVRHRSRWLAGGTALLTVIVFLNQFMVLDKAFYGMQPESWQLYFDAAMTALSWVNLLLYAVTVAAAVQIFYRRGRIPFPASFRRAFTGRAVR